MLDEAHAGLIDVTDAYRHAGLDAADAARRAVADFGEAREVAPAFQSQLDIAALRRTAAITGVPLPIPVALCNLLWDLNPNQADTLTPALTHALPLVVPILGAAAAAVAAATGLTALAVLAMTGRPAPHGVQAWDPRTFRVAGWTGAGALVTGLATLAVIAPALAIWPPFLTALALSTSLFMLMSARHRTPRTALAW